MKHLILMISLCALVLVMGCRHSTIHYKNGTKLRGRVLDADAQHVYVLAPGPQEKILTVERSDIAEHRPPGRLTTALAGFQALSTLYVLTTIHDELAPGARSLFTGIIVGSAATAILGIVIRRDAKARYERGTSQEFDSPARVRVEPVLSTGSTRTLAGFRLRF